MIILKTQQVITVATSSIAHVSTSIRKLKNLHSNLKIIQNHIKI